MMMPRLGLLVLSILVLAYFAACGIEERDTKVTMDEGIPPRFKLVGSGELAMLRIHGQQVREAPGEEAFIIWEIIPKTGRWNGKKIEDLETITFGHVPEGYIQTYPKDGQAPPLLEDQKYDVFFDTINANGARGSFVIHSGKVLWKPDDFKQRMLNRDRK